MPAVFAYGLEPDAGPGLVFITLPMIFAQLSGGSVVAVIFYFCLFVAALTSAVSRMPVLSSSRRFSLLCCALYFGLRFGAFLWPLERLPHFRAQHL